MLIYIYIAQNFFMEESEEITYYELPPNYIENFIIPMFTIAENVSKIVPELGPTPEFVDITDSLYARIYIANTEDSFLMGYHDCLVVLELMGKLKFYYRKAVLPNTEGKKSLNKEELAARKMFDHLMVHIKEISEGIIKVFPKLAEPFYQEERRIQKEKDEAKTLGLDKKMPIMLMSLANEQWADYLLSLFDLFERFILLGTSEFSERVRAADFCCITEVREFKQLFDTTLEITNIDKDYKFSLSLRDVVVMLMMNSISQKSYFTDCGDDLIAFYQSQIIEEDDFSATEIRDHMLRYGETLKEYIYEAVKDKKGFQEAIRPIFDFPV